MKGSPRLLYVYWLDASSGTDQWINVDEIEDPDLLCSTVGWVIKEDQWTMTLAQTVGSNPQSEDVANTWVIPKKMVLIRVELPEPPHPNNGELPPGSRLKEEEMRKHGV